MHTQNVNVKTAAQETAGRWGAKPVKYFILLAEWQKSAPEDEADVIQFDSLSELSAYRKREPEKMCMGYHYILTSGTGRNGFTHIGVVDASHNKQFIREIKLAGLNV